MGARLKLERFPTNTLAHKVIEGLYGQRWSVLGLGGSWDQAMLPLQEYVERKVERAVKAEREACIDVVARHGGSVEIEVAIRERGTK